MTVPNIKEISPDWKGETCFILAGGPSLSGFPVETLRGHGRVIAVNSSYRLCPWADLLFFSDPQWYKWEQEKNPELLAAFVGRMMTVGEIPDHSIHRLALTGTDDIEPLPDRVHGNNSGYQAINVAYHYGVKRIVLLGFDMKVEGEKSHWHEGHPDGISLEHRRKVLSEILLPPFATLVLTLQKAGIEIVNCTPGSALTCFPMCSIEDMKRQVWEPAPEKPPSAPGRIGPDRSGDSPRAACQVPAAPTSSANAARNWQLASGEIMSNSASRRLLAGSGAAHYYTIDARGTDPVLTEQRVRAAIVAAHRDAIGTSQIVNQEHLKRTPQK